MYYLAKEEYRNYILLIASLWFYSYGEPHFIVVMIASIMVNYGLALLVDKYKTKCIGKLCLILDLAGNLGILFVYKYFDYLLYIMAEKIHLGVSPIGITLPIGISFFTFQALSYVIDVYRGTVKVQKNPLYLALYISFFPQLIAGPIVRYSTIERQITERKSSTDLFADGVRRFMLGFGKKVLLANNLALIPQQTFSRDVTITNPLFLWMGSVAYSLQIFYDFSGYSDMAIGLGKMFGFEFEENFNYPYISKTVTEFWRRWHISLGQWFKDYVYIPLGGAKTNAIRHILNMLVVWTLTGIWHGANITFWAWGFGYFVLLVIEKYLVKPSHHENVYFRIFWRIITLVCVNFGWVIFNSESLKAGVKYCLAMLGYYRYQTNMIDTDIVANFRQYGVFIIMGILFSTPIMKMLREKILSEGGKKLFAILEPVVVSVVFLWAVSYLILGAHNPFIYFNF
ncbi:MBOAT family O-acyltransferase [Butyrivibrio sp. YAB3001]|uniref:MBOAT family O-acyltransferase n=1 Tax=Butyrivibrio sp. YAB3001 TaxID=1520812 RepID=UPI001FA839C9